MRGKRSKSRNEDRDINIIIKKCVFIIISLIVFCSFCVIFIKANEKVYMNFLETSNIEYNVFLKENSYYKENYVEQNKQYIASLIDYISVDFNYNIELLDNPKEYKEYTYKIEATANVNDGTTNNSIYTFTDTLVEEKNLKMLVNKANIQEKVKIDFNNYNKIISEFVDIYDLSSSKNFLEINMYVSTIDNMNKSVASVYIPLTTKTVAIDVSNDLGYTKNNPILLEAKNNPIKYVFLIGGIGALGIAIYFSYSLIKYILETRTEESIYNGTKKSILLNYGAYIQSVDDYDYTSNVGHIIKVNRFIDLLKIKDELSRPILMIEKENNVTIFIVLDTTSVVYIFTLNEKQELLAEKNPVYNGG